MGAFFCGPSSLWKTAAVAPQRELIHMCRQLAGILRLTDALAGFCRKPRHYTSLIASGLLPGGLRSDVLVQLLRKNLCTPAAPQEAWPYLRLSGTHVTLKWVRGALPIAVTFTRRLAPRCVSRMLLSCAVSLLEVRSQ